MARFAQRAHRPSTPETAPAVGRSGTSFLSERARARRENQDWRSSARTFATQGFPRHPPAAENQGQPQVSPAATRYGTQAARAHPEGTGFAGSLVPTARPETTNTTAGLKPGASPDKPDLIGGIGDTLRDVGDVTVTAFGNVVGAAAALITGIDIDTVDTQGPAWGPHGDFNWNVGFQVTGRNQQAGWIVQKITNTYRGEDSNGAAIDNARVGATPSYYEAWAVDNAGVVTPAAGATNDMFQRPDLSVWPAINDNATKGRWSMRAKVYFTTTDPTANGLAPGNVPDAGILPSSVNEPPDLGVARLARFANGTWDSTRLLPTHSGSNR